MSDPCLTCPLPVCDERNPSCAYRQSEEFQRIRALRIAQKQRQRDKQRRQQATGDFLTANRADLVNRAMRDRCKILWASGADTYDIAERIGVPEAQVYNELFA